MCVALFEISLLRTIDGVRLQRRFDRWARIQDFGPFAELLSPQIPKIFPGLPFRDAQRQLGAAVVLHITSGSEPPTPRQRQLIGPFDLWDGQWWRIPVSAFHHDSILHLLLNCTAAWMLGRRLERRWGHLKYVLFLGPAILIPLLAEALLGHAAIGFSGAICAMLGALMALQQSEEHDDNLPDEAIAVALGMILLGIPATALELVSFANLAHISGVTYGWCAAWLFCGAGRQIAFARPAFVAAHVMVIPGLWFVTHPVNNARYLWHLAEPETGPRANNQVSTEQKERLLLQAVQLDPTLTGIWLLMAEQKIVEGDQQQAWKLLVEGLSHNPSDADLMTSARRVWRRVPFGPERDAATAELRRHFGDRATGWLQQIQGTSVAVVQHQKSVKKSTSAPDLDPKNFPLDQSISLPWQPDRAPHEPSRTISPDQPDSASEGTSL